MDVVIKILNPNSPPSYYLYAEGRKVTTVTTPDEARVFTNPQKAKMEILKLMLDCKIPKRNLLLDNYQERR